MLEGTLVAEGLRVGARLEGVNLVVRRISKRAPKRTAVYQPDVWTLIDFEVDESDAAELADALAKALNAHPAWYVDFRSASEIFVVFPGRVFRYQRGDAKERKHAQEYGRHVGVPLYQLDWPP